MPDLTVECKTATTPKKCHLCQQQLKDPQNEGRKVVVPRNCGLPNEGRMKYFCLACLQAAISIAVQVHREKQAQVQQADVRH